MSGATATGSDPMHDAQPEVDETGAWQPGRTWRVTAVAVLLLAGLGYLWEAWHLPAGTVDEPGHGLYPRVAGLLFVVPLLGVLVAELRTDPGGDRGGTEGSWRKPLVVLATVLGYVLVAPWVGHMVAGALVIAVVVRVAGSRPWWQVLTVAVASAVGSYLLIVTALGLPLPAGELGLAF